MASRQTKRDKLPREEKVKQDEWACSYFKAAGVCEQGFLWTRLRGGYDCLGGTHSISDFQLAMEEGNVFKVAANIRTPG